MELIEFKNNETSVSAEVFLAFQDNVKNALTNYKTGEFEITEGYAVYEIVLTKDENNTVNLSLIWEPSQDIVPGWDYTVGHLPQEFRPKQGYIYGGARGENPYGPASFVVCDDDGRVVITASQNSKKIAMSCTYKAIGGEEI